MWQDYVIAIVVFVFTLTIIPMIRSRVVLPLWTTLPMVLGAAVLIGTYSTLGLWTSVAVETGTLIGWTILAVRSISRVRS